MRLAGCCFFERNEVVGRECGLQSGDADDRSQRDLAVLELLRHGTDLALPEQPNHGAVPPGQLPGPVGAVAGPAGEVSPESLARPGSECHGGLGLVQDALAEGLPLGVGDDLEGGQGLVDGEEVILEVLYGIGSVDDLLEVVDEKLHALERRNGDSYDAGCDAQGIHRERLG